MENFNIDEYQKLKNSIELQYKKIVSIYSPALKAQVFFNAGGWHHLRYDYNKSERSKPAQLNKLRFFNNAANTIKLSTTIQEYRRHTTFNEITGIDNMPKISIVEWFAFWEIISFTKSIRIRVIVRRVGGNDGNFHFWSVMPFWNLQHKKRSIGSQELENE